MFIVNFVFDDEELLEPYEWQDDDDYKEFYYLPIYRVTSEVLHDFLYGKLKVMNCEETMFIVSDGHYNLVVELKNHCIFRRGTMTLAQREHVNHITNTLGYTTFHYEILEEAYEKEFGLTREERMKKICIEEVIDEIFVVHYDLFLDICKEFHIQEDEPSAQYLALKQKIERGYSSLHELLYKELIQKG